MTSSPTVFLGGGTRNTMWRKDTAIPFLAKHGISYYDPIIENWTPAQAAVEAKAKQESEILLFVVNSESRCVASMIEVAEFAVTKPHVVVVINNIAEDNSEFTSANEIKDLNGGRVYLKELLDRHGCLYYNSLDEALEKIKSISKQVK